jgi:hypothetical protein
MNEAETFALADQALDRVVAQVRDDQLEERAPAWFHTSSRTPDATLRELLNYHAYDDAWVPDMLAGRTMDEVGVDKWQGDLLGDDIAGRFHAIVETAVASARQVREEQLDTVTVHCSFGDFTMREYFWQINQFRALRAHDIARWIGVESNLPAELVQGVWDEVSPHAEAWRKVGVFRAAVDVPDDAPLLDRLLAITGRDPKAGLEAAR